MAATNSKLTFGDFYTIVWSLVPTVWKNADDEYGKSLQLLLYTMSQHMYYYFYNRIVHMEELFDPDRCPDKYLRFLAGMLGWTLVGNDPMSWREQIKAAPLLYKFRGTKRGLLLAEKLVGYSVFMSELYRDHIGDIVPKERIFNNTPASVLQKPWFRNTLLSVEGELLPGYAESDQFESFNATNLVKLDSHGSVIRPRIITSTRQLVFTPNSTTNRYINSTGKYSRARYAKMPRINIVLKYGADLDTENADGTIKENNFKGALDLLMQFKPFHVLIENLEVRYDLSEFIFDQTTIPSDIFNVQEELDSAVVINMARAENTIAYSSIPAVEATTIEDTLPASPLDNRGSITSIYKIIDLSLLSPSKETSLYSVQRKALPTKVFIKNAVSGSGVPLPGYAVGVFNDTIVTMDDFTTPSPGSSNTYTSYDLFGNIIDEVYNPGHDIIKYDIGTLVQEPILDFKTMLSSQHGKTTVSFNQTTADDNGFNKIRLGYYCPATAQSPVYEPVGMKPEIYVVGLNTANTITNTNLDWPYEHPITNASSQSIPYRSTVLVKIDSNSYIQSIDSGLSRPWDLQAANNFSTIAGITLTETIKYVYNNTMMVLLKDGSNYLVLTQGEDYYFDNNKNIFLNSATIGVRLSGGVETTYNFLLTKSLHILYLSRTTNNNETDLGTPIRGFRLVNRNTNKYSRQFLINTLSSTKLSNIMPTNIISIDGKTKQKTILGIKKCNTFTDIYTRSSLKNQMVNNYNIVSRYSLNRIDKSKWTVYSPEYTAYYLGDQKITNNWWGNYYEAKFSVPQVPYDQIDVSTPGQLEHVSSDQWLSALQTYNPSDPAHFLVTRKNDVNRSTVWNRSSCKFAAVPYIQGRRDSVQVFRKDTTTFNRSEASTDYTTDTNTPPRIDNYKYILPDGTDVSMSYFSPGFSEVERTLVTMDRGLGTKATLSNTGYNLIFPASDTYYNNYSSGLEPETYFSGNNPNYRIKTSLYAGNIPVNLDPNTTPGINESLDKLDLLITGVFPITDTFTVISNETNFVLSENNLYVSWISENTGETAAFGYYSPAAYGGILYPNIQVTINGTLIKYNRKLIRTNGWFMDFGAIKSITILEPLLPHDIITVSYEIIPGQPEDIAPPLPQIAHTISNTITTTSVDTILRGNRYIIALPSMTSIPCVSWYNSITGYYINSSSLTVAYQPAAFYETAVPNINVSVNGVLTKYKKDWLFLLNADKTASIALSPTTSYTLTETDIVLVDYFSTT